MTIGAIQSLLARTAALELGLASKALEPTYLDAVLDLGIALYTAFGGIPFDPGLNSSASSASSALVTVINADADKPISADWLKDRLERMEDCDVYRSDLFLTGLVLTSIKGKHALTPDCRDYLKTLGNQWLSFQADSGLAASPGPYLYTDRVLKPVYRLYDDKQRAFLTALRPQPGGPDSTPFLQLRTASTLYDTLSIAVPPRSPENLDGSPRRLRVVVKDIFAMNGLKTSLCNRAYYEYSERSSSTAAVVQSLVQAGAHILGMNKLSSMVAREEPMDAVEFLTAFNPRGDGYQSPAGSSSGTAASVAAYDWVDCGIGTDTSGSGRRPAMVNGVWEFRPSHDYIDLTGMVATYLLFDTPVVFARSLDTIGRVVQTWLGSSTLVQQPTTPKSYNIICLLDYLPVKNSEQMKLIDEFVDDMMVHLPAAVTSLSLREAWAKNHPPDTPDNVDDYLKNVVTQTYYYHFYHASDDFRQGYAETHDGRPPYVIPFVQRRWAKGAAVSADESKEAAKKLQVYKKWLLSTLFRGEGGGSTTLIVLPVANASPNYRDTVSASPEEQSALDELFLQPILGSPDIVVPIGEVPYHSRISDKVEYLPVVANLVGAPGSDLELLDAVQRVMAASKRSLTVATGSRMLPDTRKVK